eukprot:Plantae.Rhodophyta-Hildenbrandia_rubra.ctg17754.p1 GENE.Plantae.Rhodophyta-Hildenbrandia_rubra.ctg17754~~Plantae.Rhodophyta-Hildenbrandia_rubra.ctg17754.p1  ORF type:complete len:548 (+),score=121.88 Plantae.Rhodophyta-Hildenbrandia_rubra.ctg17754:40-1644(+)
MPSFSPWSLPRFVKTLFWYSPLGRALREEVDIGAEVRRREMDKISKSGSGGDKKGVVFVSGASGLTGRRVVRDLVEGGWKVKALVRNESRARKVLGEVGVVVDGGDKEEGNVEFVVSDLWNLNKDWFKDVDVVVSVTGTKVGPKDDDVDRSKYRQGVVYYPPVVLEETPENVEYKGIKALVEAAKDGLVKSDERRRMKGVSTPVLSFDDERMVKNMWNQVDDVVMGGVSSSKIDVDRRNKAIVFSGAVSSDNFGGFASARTVDFSTPLNLSRYSGIELKVRGDGKRYKFIVRCDKRWDGISHCHSFDTKKGETMTVRIPWSDFITVFRAKTVKDGDALNPRNITAFQIMLSKFEYDGGLNPNFETGPFNIMIESIGAYKGEVRNRFPQIIHLGSAGSTRVLRYDNLDDQIPIVKLSKQLGRLLEWKLAGEDVIRSSGLRYCIVRACALTEEEKKGFRALQLDQGDNISGKISRKDVSNFMTAALESEKLVNCTVEIAGKESPVREEDSVEAVANGVQRDNVESRTFAEFPFVPK